jgi:cold shock CspA family protein
MTNKLATYYTVFDEEGAELLAWCADCHEWHEHSIGKEDFNADAKSFGFRLPHHADKSVEYELMNHGPADDRIKKDATQEYPVGPTKLGHIVRMSTMATRLKHEGVIQTLVPMKGFGFILMDFTTRVFFHVSQWHGATSPAVGQQVTFSVVPAKPGTRHEMAINVRPVEGGK